MGSILSVNRSWCWPPPRLYHISQCNKYTFYIKHTLNPFCSSREPCLIQGPVFGSRLWSYSPFILHNFNFESVCCKWRLMGHGATCWCLAPVWSWDEVRVTCFPPCVPYMASSLWLVPLLFLAWVAFSWHEQELGRDWPAFSPFLASYPPAGTHSLYGGIPTLWLLGGK